MNMNRDTSTLTGSWTHSYEEDAGGVQVYRPTQSFAFPPSRRGRETLEFGGGGQMQSGMPGADDRPQKSGMTAMGANRLQLGSGQLVEIVEAGPDVLKVRPV